MGDLRATITAMRATCPTCDTAYTIPDDRIGPKGRKVRCTRCGEEWRAFPHAEAAEAPAVVARPAPIAAAASLAAASDDRLEATVADDVAAPADTFADAPRDDGFRDDDLRDHALRDDPPAVDTAVDAADAPAAAAEPPRKPADVRLRVKRRTFRLRLPQMPVALTRATPFVGPLVFVSALLVVAALVLFRTSVVAAAPGLAGFYATIGLEVNLRGLTFGPIDLLREMDNGQPVLVVEGTLMNPTKDRRDVPALRFALRDGDDQELYAWSIDPKDTSIAAGDRLRFRTRLVSPPERAADLQVRFIERRNHQAGLP